MTQFAGGAIMRDEARIWNHGLTPKTHPEIVTAPDESVHHHVRSYEYLDGNGSNHTSPEYYEAIYKVISGSDEILLLGHGKGKASAMLHLIQYLERKHPLVGKKVVDALETDLQNLSEGEIMAIGREWIAAHPN